MKKLLCALPLTIVLASSAAAQSFAHKGTDITIGYDEWSASSVFGPGGFDGSTTLARVRTDWGFGTNFGTQLNLDYAEFQIDGAPFDGSTRTFALHPYWEQAGSFRAGLFYQTTQFEFGLESLSYYGIEGMFTPNEALSWEFYLGRGQFESSSSADFDAYGTTVSYAVNEKFAMHMAYDREHVDDFSASGASNSRFNVGLDYSFGGNGQLPPVTLTAEVGTVDIFGIFNLDVVGAKLTVPLGGTAGANGRKLYRERGIYWAVGGAAPFF